MNNVTKETRYADARDIEEMKRLGEAYEKAYEAYRAAQDRVPPMCR